MEEVKNPGGRPRGCETYTPEIAAEICERLALGQTLLSICRDPHMPGLTTVHKWLLLDHEGFATDHARARKAGVHAIVDQARDIADTPVDGVITTDKWTGTEVQHRDMLEHRRLQVDTRKWYASKIAPQIYGERLHTELTGADGGPIEINTGDDEGIATRLTAILDAIKRRMADDGYDIV